MNWRLLTVISLCSLWLGANPFATGPVPALAVESERSGLFGSSEIRNERLDAFVKWTDMVDRHDWETARTHRPEPCRITPTLDCRRDQWITLLADLQGRQPAEQVDAINRFMNEGDYISDMRNWGIADYWATVREFLHKDGDCEDYAIAKYYSLKALGFDTDAMRIVVVQDTNLDTPHAVLALEFGNETLILDNQLSDVVRASSIVHYRPIYSINESAWWLHRL